MKGQIFPYLCQHLALLLFFILVILTGVWYLSAVFICIFIVPSDVEHLFMCVFTIIFPTHLNVSSCLLSIFQLDHWVLFSQCFKISKFQKLFFRILRVLSVEFLVLHCYSSIYRTYSNLVLTSRMLNLNSSLLQHRCKDPVPFYSAGTFPPLTILHLKIIRWSSALPWPYPKPYFCAASRAA